MQVYTRDSSVMTPYGAIITAMANWWRRGENYAAIRNYERLGIPIYDMVTAGTFEGGDFNVIEENCVLIGCGGGRTQEEGARQVEGWFRREGWETRLAFFDEYYVHIDLMVVPIAPKLTAVCLDCTEPEIVDWLRAKGHELIDVPFPDTINLGCNFMSLGRDRVIAPEIEPGADRPAARARLRGRRGGYERDLEDRRRHSLHGAGAAARSAADIICPDGVPGGAAPASGCASGDASNREFVPAPRTTPRPRARTSAAVIQILAARADSRKTVRRHCILSSAEAAS